jgi:hypothetical protein
VKPGDDELDDLLKRLHLANARRIWPSLVERAEKEQWSFRDFIALLVKEEIAQRQQTRLGRPSRWAGLPFLKTIDDFNFNFQSTVRLSLLGSALSVDFVTEGRCLVFLGKPMDPRCAPGTSGLTTSASGRQVTEGTTWPEFPEFPGQDPRNLQPKSSRWPACESEWRGEREVAEDEGGSAAGRRFRHGGHRRGSKRRGERGASCRPRPGPREL